MIKTKTLLILGAGASAPFGFPLGRELRDRIYEMLVPPGEDESHVLLGGDGGHGLPGKDGNFYELPSDSPLVFLMDVGSSDPNCYYDHIQEFREALLKSGRFSVDAFLEHRLEKFGIVGRRAIAVALRRYENPETFKRMIKEKKNNWYELLVEALIEDVPFEKFSELSGKNLAIVTFNYDRSLEYYLHESLIHNYGITSEEAAEKINEIGIIHVHGKLGDLPWQKNPEFQLSYDTKITPTMVGQMAENIKIIPTATISTPEFIQARRSIDWASCIYILGFGFNKQNLDRLQLGQRRRQGGKVYGTGMGLRYRDVNTIVQMQISGLENIRVRAQRNQSIFPDKTTYDYLWDDIDLTE